MEMIWLAAKIAYGVLALLTWAGFISYYSYQCINEKKLPGYIMLYWDWSDVFLYSFFVGFGAALLWPLTLFVGGCIGTTYLANKMLKKPQPSQVL